MPNPSLLSRRSVSLASRTLFLALCVLAGPTACSDSTGPSYLQGPSSLWRPDPSSLPSTGNYVVIASDPGDYIGAGLKKVFRSPTDSVWAGWKEGRLYFGAAPVVGGMLADDGYFTGDFIGPSGDLIAVGYYSGLERWPFNDPLKGGMAVSGSFRGCNTLNGWFTIDRISFSDTTLATLDMRFEQYCDGTGAVLHGAIHWNR